MSDNLLFQGEAILTDSARQHTVRELMRPPTTTIEPEAHLAAAAYLMKHFHDSALVVVADNTHEPIAMITEAEIARAVADEKDLEDTRITQIVTAKPVTVQADVVAADAVRLMLSRGVRHLPVVEGRRLVGMVELADLVRVSLAPGPSTVEADSASRRIGMGRRAEPDV